LRAILWRLARRCLALLRGRPYGGSLRGALLLLTAIAGVGFVLAGGSATGQAREYSAYDDPEKPAISLILSEEQNVEEFREKFALSDEEVEEALAAVRRENEALAREYAESERIVEANEGLPAERVEDKIAASDYDEEVRAAVAETKVSIEALLPEEQRPELKAWVDAKFVQQGQEFSEESSATYQAASRGVRCKVFATQYNGYTRFEVALPHRKLKKVYLNGNPVRVRIRRGDHHTKVRVKEVGPWNTYDNYWNLRRAYEKKWDNLPHLKRCIPWAQAAYYHNYNHGEDEFGREVLNPAGVDLTPRVARRLGLDKYQNAWVYVRYPWVRR
jgi:hypothetical protein